MKDIKSKINDLWNLLVDWVKADKRHKWILVSAATVFFLFMLSGGERKSNYIFKGEDYKRISKGRTIKNPYRDLAVDKMALIERAEKSIRKENKEILSKVSSMESSLGELSDKLDLIGKKEPEEKDIKIKSEEKEPSKPDLVTSSKAIQVGQTTLSGPNALPLDSPKGNTIIKPRGRRKNKLGPYSVVFPVNVESKDERSGIVIGKGSRAFGKVIGGAEVPMGETYPVLIQLDYAFVMANEQRVDLKGCVLIAKSETVFATGKMKMEPDSITCYGPSGSLYSKNKIKGWFNDPKDDNFGMRAELKTNAGKKSLGVFGSAFAEGLGAAIERGSRSVGGNGVDVRPDVVIKDSGQKAGANAGKLFMEYLNGLKPTLKVTSGRETWFILGSELVIPYEFFEKRREYAKSRDVGVAGFVK